MENHYLISTPGRQGSENLQKNCAVKRRLQFDFVPLEESAGPANKRIMYEDDLKSGEYVQGNRNNQCETQNVLPGDSSSNEFAAKDMEPPHCPTFPNRIVSRRLTN